VIVRRIRAIGIVATCLAGGGCQTAASFDAWGSYLPGWLVCSAVAIVLAVAAHLALRRLGIEPAAPVVAYPALVVAVTCAQWLLFLR
jgi:hypothetical protein